jgi:hypothetical protein
MAAIKAINLKTGLEVIYPSIDKIDDNFGLKKYAVKKVLSGKQKTHKGFTFEAIADISEFRLSTPHDAEGFATGRAASFERSQPQRMYTEFGGLRRESASFITPEQFEVNHANILSLQFRGMLPNLFGYLSTPTTFNTRQMEILLRSFAGGGVAIGLNQFDELVVLGTVSGIATNPYSEFIGTTWDFSMSGDGVTGRYQITQRNINRVISGELDVMKGFVVVTNKNTWLDWWQTDTQLIEHYAGLLAIIKTSERSNLIQARTPYIVKTSKDGIQAEIIKEKMLAGDLFFNVDSMDFQSQIVPIPLNVPDKTATFQNSYSNTLNEMLTLLGIYNATESGMERLVAGQVSANSHITEVMGDIYLSARQKGIELCNLAFGTEMSVLYNQRVAQTFQGYFANPQSSFMAMEESRMTQISGMNTQNRAAGTKN